MTKGEKVAGLLNWTVFDYNRSAKEMQTSHQLLRKNMKLLQKFIITLSNLTKSKKTMLKVEHVNAGMFTFYNRF